MKSILKTRIPILLVIGFLLISQIIIIGCNAKGEKKTVVKIRYPKGLSQSEYSVEVPHYYDTWENFTRIPSDSNKEGFYSFNLSINFPQSIKLGPQWILISPTDTVIVDYVRKPYIQSKKDSTIWHFNDLQQNLQQFKLIGIIPSSSNYKDLSPFQFEQRIDSFYQAGIRYIDNYFTKNPYLDEFYKYYAKCDLLFNAGSRLSGYYLYNAGDTIRKLTYPSDFFKYNDSISKYFNRLYVSLYGYLYFNEYLMVLMRQTNNGKDYEPTLKVIINNTKGLARDILIGKAITHYQLRRFNQEFLPISLRYAPKIENDQLRNTLLSRIDEMKNSQSKLVKEVLNEQPKSLSELLKNYHNKVVYVKFWATWCGPCLQDAEYLDDLNDQIKNENFKIVNICISSPKLNYEKLLSAKPHFGENIYLSDPECTKLKKEIDIPHLPYYLLIDQKKNKMVKDAPRPLPDKGQILNEELITMINKMLKD